MSSLRTPAVVLLLLCALVSCADEGGGSPDTESTPTEPAAVATNPCDVVSDAEASELLGTAVTGDRAPMERSPTTEMCDFIPADETVSSTLNIQSTPADMSFGAFAQVIVGVADEDVTQLDLEGASDAIMLVEPDVFPIVTIAAEQGGIFHVVIAGDDDAATAEQLAMDAVALVLAG